MQEDDPFITGLDNAELEHITNLIKDSLERHIYKPADQDTLDEIRFTTESILNKAYPDDHYVANVVYYNANNALKINLCKNRSPQLLQENENSEIWKCGALILRPGIHNNAVIGPEPTVDVQLDQSLYGSISPAPAIATPIGVSV